MTVHQLQGAIAAMEAAKVQQAETQHTYMDIDDVSLEGNRSDKDACDEQSVIKALRQLNDFINRKAKNTLNIDTDSDSPDYIKNRMIGWRSFKARKRAFLKGCQRSRQETVAGPYGGRTGITTGSVETMSQSVREQIHLANLPTEVKGKQKSVPAILRWEYADDRAELDADGEISRWPYWAVEPVFKTYPDGTQVLDEDGEPIEVRAGIKHDKAEEPIVMWRLKAVYFWDGFQADCDEFNELADKVHAAVQTVKKNRKVAEDAQLTPDNVENWPQTIDDLF